MPNDIASANGADVKEAAATARDLSKTGTAQFDSVASTGTRLFFESVAKRSIVNEAANMIAADGAPIFDIGRVELSNLNGPSIAFDISRLIDGIDKMDIDQEFHGFEVTIGAITVFATAGYIVWALRGSVLVATLMSQLPSWQLIDPLPVLETYRTARLEKDHDEVGSFFN